jgi:hypothetical protein
MAEKCVVCGNEYDGAFTITRDGESLTFDCFECAIERVAPRCTRCGTRVIGHGVQEGETVFCSAHCAHAAGVEELRDRV